VETIYSQREHTAMKMSPALAATCSTRPIRTVDPRALDLLLMPVAGGDGTREVTKFGVRVDGFHYVVHEADVGMRVLVRRDPNDAGRVYTFDAEDGRFVGEGLCPELAGIDPSELLRAKREITSARLAEGTREIRAAIKEITRGPALIERVLDVAARDMPNVIALPKRTEAHATQAIAAALDAVAPRPASTPTPSTEILAMQARLKADEAIVPLRTEETPHQRWKRSLELIARLDAGAPASPDELLWLGGYRTGPEFRGFALTYGNPFEKNPAASDQDAAGSQQTI
jgi:putative transposase